MYSKVMHIYMYDFPYYFLLWFVTKYWISSLCSTVGPCCLSVLYPTAVNWPGWVACSLGPKASLQPRYTSRWSLSYDFLTYCCCCCWVTSVVSDSVQAHRRQPTRLPHAWDSPGKNTGVGCHFLLHCIKVKSESEVAQSCLILSDPMDCGPPGSSVHGIFQAKVPEWVAIAFSFLTYRSEQMICTQ